MKVVVGQIKKSCSNYLILRNELEAEPGHNSYLSNDDIHTIHSGQHQARCVPMLHTLYVASTTYQKCHHCPALQVIQTPTHMYLVPSEKLVWLHRKILCPETEG